MSRSPSTCPPPDHHRDLLRRVRGLLAKAEATDFAEEAAAFSAKAQELMTRHAIDAALLDAGARTGGVAVDRRLVHVDDPYSRAKSLLLSEVASASGGRVIVHPAERVAVLFGVAGELEAIELLYTSLLVQSTEAMLRAGRPAGPTSPSATAAFRRSFLSAFALRIGQRLRVAADAAATRAAVPGDLLPVLARRDEAVGRAVDEAYPFARSSSALRLSSPDGVASGIAAADRADLGAEGSRVAAASEGVRAPGSP